MKSQDPHAILDRSGPVCQRPAEDASEEPPRRHLSVGARVAIFLVGWVLILVGIAGLVLPGIQGGVTILAGAALLSVDNKLFYRLLHRGLHRWPWIWSRVERFREKAHVWAEKLHRRQ